MTNINNGKIDILIDENNNHHIVFSPVNGQVWLSKSELAELFGVYIQTVNSHIEAVYKTGAFKEEETCKYNLYTSGNRIKYDKTHFNLSVIIALAFRINSFQADILRSWVIENILNESFAEFRYCPN